ncbi:sensor domain-containing diguanylate cyclase [Fictibacillus nanhaiensis]|uniref:sensor domain-containing diguanylate cyclase n=1 Tax=Fictibacillus nanhaiensis TaxID=742169 RepID=UPI001C954473|nr:sensor domain-containing diguanylate cyclase [Fictibacillus nanhaiensis]MBY6035310.1 sensor domain-containing diguanylate cyclase [Fictibacillus nanhaiensis]
MELMRNRNKRMYVVIAWVLFFPLAVWTAVRLTSNQPDINFIDLGIISLLAIIVSFFPIKVLDTNISFMSGINLAVFLYFGLTAALYMTVLSLIAMFISLRINIFKEYYRYMANILMFSWIIIIEGAVFKLLGGETGAFDLNESINLIPIIGYFITGLVLNHVGLYFIVTVLYEEDVPFIDRDAFWDVVSELLVIPVGLMLYMLYSQMGRPAIFYVGVPFLSLSIIINLYHSSKQINDSLQKASEIGQQLSEHLKVNPIIDIFIEKLIAFMKVDFAFIYDADAGEHLKIIRKYESEEGILAAVPIKKQEAISGRVWSTGKSIRYSKSKHWHGISETFFQGKAESVLSVPMIRNQKIVGIITFASKEEYAYQKHHLIILEILANYLAVAIDNARNYESTKLKSEQCPLTGLYNYRYFEDLLTNMYNNYEYFRKKFSVILLDIDHFKAVNDTYGHQSGNDVLILLARRLEEFVHDRGTVARYGGEEFIILLPESGEQECLEIAEQLRSVISNKGFEIQNDLTDQQKKLIYITASIGIATAPHQGEDPLTLVRNADRAMYTGAKQQGRNKVAAYIG